jgi:hypothetical protein
LATLESRASRFSERQGEAHVLADETERKIVMGSTRAHADGKNAARTEYLFVRSLRIPAYLRSIESETKQIHLEVEILVSWLEGCQMIVKNLTAHT